MEYDLIISGGRVIDGTGADAIQADIAINNGRIARIGDLSTETAAETIDAAPCLTSCAAASCTAALSSAKRSYLSRIEKNFFIAKVVD